MLRLPTRGFAYSVTKHNGSLDIQADWVEASVLFADEQVTQTDIVDVLMSNNIYKKQDFANEWARSLLGELERRFRLLGEAGALQRASGIIQRKRDWRERPAYSFCVALTVLPLYRREVEIACGEGYAEQGRLFEQISEIALRSLDWKVWSVAWSKDAATSIDGKVRDLAAALGETVRTDGVAHWTDPDAKDAGLDLVAWREFSDGWPGRPICLMQCASGADWEDKLHTPNIGTWEKLIDFATKPRRGLAMPFAPDADTFRRRANRDEVMLLMDRHRVLRPRPGGNYVALDDELSRELRAWTAERVKALPVDPG